MSMVTSGAQTWVEHTHRNHHGGGTIWLFGPDGPTNVSGPDPISAPSQIGDYDFLFWNASGSQGGGLAYPAGELTPSAPVPAFPAGGDPGSLIAWYLQHGGNGTGGPGLVFDAFSETAGDWIDWDHTNDPFTVTSGTRGAPPDDDDTVSTGNAPGTVAAAHTFPGTSLVFDKWLLFSEHAEIDGSGHDQVSEDEGTSGVAIAVYRQPDHPWHVSRQYVAYDPWWWLKNSPVEVEQTILGQQSQVTQIASLLDLSSAISDSGTRAAVQRGMYEALVSIGSTELARRAGTHGIRLE